MKIRFYIYFPNYLLILFVLNTMIRNTLNIGIKNKNSISSKDMFEISNSEKFEVKTNLNSENKLENNNQIKLKENKNLNFTNEIQNSLKNLKSLRKKIGNSILTIDKVNPWSDTEKSKFDIIENNKNKLIKEKTKKLKFSFKNFRLFEIFKRKIRITKF